MKTIDETIEERASEYAHTEWISEFTDVAKESYTKGATEQKAIDIDKACEWFTDYLMEIGYPDDWMRDSPNMASGKERFIKAMEE